MNWLQLAWLVIAVLILACNCLTLWYVKRTREAIRVRGQYEYNCTRDDLAGGDP